MYLPSLALYPKYLAAARVDALEKCERAYGADSDTAISELARCRKMRQAKRYRRECGGV
jgi:hypothetical protein